MTRINLLPFGCSRSATLADGATLCLCWSTRFGPLRANLKPRDIKRHQNRPTSKTLDHAKRKPVQPFQKSGNSRSLTFRSARANHSGSHRDQKRMSLRRRSPSVTTGMITAQSNTTPQRSRIPTIHRAFSSIHATFPPIHRTFPTIHRTTRSFQDTLTPHAEVRHGIQSTSRKEASPRPRAPSNWPPTGGSTWE